MKENINKSLSRYKPKNNFIVLVVSLLVLLSLLPQILMAISKDTNTVLGTVYGKVTDEEGIGIPAVLRFISPESDIFETHYTDWLGGFELHLPATRYTIEIMHGPEYEIARSSFTLVPNEKKKLTFSLSRLYDLSKIGWFGGDAHLHSSYSDGSDDVALVALAAISNGLSWAFLTDHNTVEGHSEWLAARRFLLSSTLLEQKQQFIAIPGEEITTELGHFNVAGNRELVGWTPSKGSEDLKRIFSEAVLKSSITIVNHPFAPDNLGYKNWELINFFNALEVWNGRYPPYMMENYEAMSFWFELLNQGMKIAGISGTDCHDITGEPYGSLSMAPSNVIIDYFPISSDFFDEHEAEFRSWFRSGLYPGNPRVYVNTPVLNEFNVLGALSRGNCFITNGPLVLVNIDDKGPGEVIPVIETKKLELDIKIMSNQPLSKIIIIQGGRIVKEKKLAGLTDYVTKVDIDPNIGDWIIVQVFGNYPLFAITNPIYLDSDVQEVTSKVKIIGPESTLIYNGSVKVVSKTPNAMNALIQACIISGNSWREMGGLIVEIAGYEMQKSAGWMYEVNGEIPTVGAKDYFLKDGDEVVWYWSSW